MLRSIFLTIAFTLSLPLFKTSAAGSDFNRHFADSTLRLDYIFGGDSAATTIMLANISKTDGWAGRRHNLSTVPLQGNGQISLISQTSGDTLYTNSFSTLYQEWLATPESSQRKRAFENTFLVPLPHTPVNVEVKLFDCRHNTVSQTLHPLDPSDNLISDLSKHTPSPHRYIHQSSTPDKAIDVAILAEGYTEAEADRFYSAAQTAVESILSHAPFSSHADNFNFIAVAAPSKDSGVSIPRLNEWKETACGSNFGTFYFDRYLTTSNLFDVHDRLVNLPYEHIIILANTDEYGGGGIYNLYTLTTAGHPLFRPVVVHEFGHSFGGLADEYFYDDDDPMENLYPDGVEPWEQNLTTLTAFDTKWADMISDSIPVPTPEADAHKFPVGIYQGGGYRSKGVYRPAYECRMRNNTCPSFCPVCIRAISRIIDFNLGRPVEKL